ncbi:hypothetical protein ACFL96_18860 [Thermoproteota archaeon]
MKKDGENSVFYRGAAHLIFIFFIIYVIGVFFVHPQFFGEGGITGYAVYDEADATQKIEAAFATATFINTIPNANICIQIKDGTDEHVFKVRKAPAGVTVTDSTDYCDGQSAEDIIIKFVSYDDFSDLMASFTVSNIIAGTGGSKYYILPSKYVKSGGDVVCNSAFKAKFCGAASQFGGAEELIAGDMYCCLDTLTREQQRLLSDHLAESGFENELAPLEEEPGSSGFLGSYFFYFIIGLFVLMGVGVVVLKKKPSPKLEKKPSVAGPAPATPPEDPKVAQLADYISNTLKTGYTKEQVYQHLVQQGWQQDIMNKAFAKATQPQTSSQQPQMPSQGV